MSARLCIDLAALRHNYALFRDAVAPGAAAAVVKADGYGLGSGRVAEALWAAGCRDYFVATAAEGAVLRGQLQEARILVFEGALEDTAETLRRHALVPVLNHPGQAALWRRHGRHPAALHVDTGMHRLGFAPDLADDDVADLDVTLLVTHLACADEPDHPMNERQLARFDSLRERFPGVPASIGNSAAALAGARRAGELARPGIGLYGGNPYLGAPSPVRPVVTLEGRILQLRSVAAGESVGYGATFTARAETRLAVVGLGYADGLPRLLSNRGAAAVAGHRCPIVGRISMDLTTLDVTGVPVREGDWAEFIGATVTVDEVALWAQTISYEILTGLGTRPERSFVG